MRVIEISSHCNQKAGTTVVVGVARRESDWDETNGICCIQKDENTTVRPRNEGELDVTMICLIYLLMPGACRNTL